MIDDGGKNPKYNKYLSKSREEILDLLGTPDEIGGTSRKYKTPSVYSYGGY